MPNSEMEQLREQIASERRTHQDYVNRAESIIDRLILERAEANEEAAKMCDEAAERAEAADYPYSGDMSSDALKQMASALRSKLAAPEKEETNALNP